MAYVAMSKIYYHGQAEYAAEYKKRFASPDAVRLPFQVGGKPAFFLQNAEAFRLAYEIAKLDKEICVLCHMLPRVVIDQYSRKCLIDEIVLTNNIEGVHSSRKEIGDALDILAQQAQKKQKHPRFVGLVNKYLKLMREEPIPLNSCEAIRALYDELFLEEVVAENAQNRPDGIIFRKEATSIYNNAQREIHKGVYPETEIISAMGQALQFLNDDTVEKLFRVCVFHFLFEYIHPFYDGNGRLGRFILSYSISETLEPLLAYRISEIIKENIKAYYKAFEVCNDPHNLADLTPFLLMQLEMIYLASAELKDSLQKRNERWNRYKELIPALFGTGQEDLRKLYYILIQSALFSENGISVKGLSAVMEISEATVRRHVEKLPQDWIVQSNKGKTRYYNANLRALDDLLLQQVTE